MAETQRIERPNIIWIFPDEWRHDAAGFAGNPVVRTPNLDSLAARGVTFGRAYCESPVCQPSRASLLTGMHVRDHGLDDNGHLPHTKGAFPGPEHPNFLHSLQDVGYRTAGIGKLHFGRGSLGSGARAYGFDEVRQEHDKYVLWRMETPYTHHLKERGLFDEWSEHNSSLLGWIPSPTGQMEPNPKARRHRDRAEPDVVPDHEMLDTFIAEEACRYIRDYDREEPFFLWVAPIGPHPPWDAPRKYTDLYDPAAIPLGPLGLDEIPDNRWGEYFRWNLKHLGCERWTEDDYRLIGQYYYGLITQVDDAIGRIVETLAATSRDRDTWIMFSSDHGEMLGDHGLISKRVFYETSVRVPQLIVPPVGQAGGRAVHAPTQNFDLPATILDLAGAEWADPRVAARSLLPAVKGGPTGREVVYSQIAGFLMVATTSHKLLVHEETLEPGAFYELVNDPDERANLVGVEGAAPAMNEMLGRAREFLGRKS
jgi:arylsulfatase